MKVALIHCPLWGTFDPPIGLAQLSLYLKKQGHQVEVFDLNIKVYLNQSENRKDIWAWEESDFWYRPEYVKRFFSNNSEVVNHYSERILKDILEKVKCPSREFRLLAGVHREKAELVNSASERNRLLKLAQEEVERSLANWPFDPWTYAEAARIYSVLGHHKQAKEAIRRALSLAPQEEKFKLLKQELAKN